MGIVLHKNSIVINLVRRGEHRFCGMLTKSSKLGSKGANGCQMWWTLCWGCSSAKSPITSQNRYETAIQNKTKKKGKKKKRKRKTSTHYSQSCNWIGILKVTFFFLHEALPSCKAAHKKGGWYWCFSCKTLWQANPYCCSHLSSWFL